MTLNKPLIFYLYCISYCNAHFQIFDICCLLLVELENLTLKSIRHISKHWKRFITFKMEINTQIRIRICDVFQHFLSWIHILWILLDVSINGYCCSPSAFSKSFYCGWMVSQGKIQSFNLIFDKISNLIFQRWII